MLRKSIFLALNLLGSSLMAAETIETWKIASLDWQPYSGEELQNQGNSVDKLRQLLKTKNIELIVEFYPWKRAQMIAATPEYVGYFPAWPEEVAEGFIGSDAVDVSELGVITSSESKPTLIYSSVEELFSKYKIGYVGTYVYPAEIVSGIDKYPDNADSSPDELSLVKKISLGRIAAGLTDPAVSMYLASKEGLSNIQAMEKILEEKALVVAFRNGPDNLKRLELLNNLIKQ